MISNLKFFIASALLIITLSNLSRAEEVLVEYTFDTDLTDTSGNGRHGIPGAMFPGDEPSVSNGKLVFNSSGFGWVDIPLDTDNPFDGATSYTIEMEFKTPEAPVILITSADEDGVGGVDHSTLYAVTGTTSGSSAGEGALYADIWWVDAAWSGDIVDHKDGNYHSVSMSYSPGVTSHFWNWKSDGIDNPGGGNEGSNNYTTDVSKHIVRIGSCANDDYTDDIGMLDLPGLKNFVGEIDYIRIIANDPPYTLYVDESASSGGDGLTWETAYIFLQDALTLANTSNMVKEIRVAQGTYIPDANSSNPDGSGDREATFQLVNGMAIYGGFPTGGSDFADRDPNRYKTILGGDLEGDDDGFTNNDENSYHVVTGNGTDQRAVLEGFTITAGNADGGGIDSQGAGMYNINSSPTVRNCFFTRNTADTGGGAMVNDQGSSPLVVNCLFVDNSVGTAGGAMSNVEASHPEIVNCFFAGNASLYYGGAMINYPSANPILTNCVFTSNSAGESAGAIATGGTSSPEVFNCTFSGNTAGINGGAIGSGGPEFTIVNSIFWHNSAPTGPQIDFSDPCSVFVSFSDFQGGWPGMGNIDADPLFKNPDGPDEIAGTADDNLELGHDSPCIDAGDSNSVPTDYADLNEDGDTLEVTPLDLASHARFTDDPVMADTGSGSPPIVDMGAYERYEFCGSAEFPYPPVDYNHDCRVNLLDLAYFAQYWLEYSGPE